MNIQIIHSDEVYQATKFDGDEVFTAFKLNTPDEIINFEVGTPVLINNNIEYVLGLNRQNGAFVTARTIGILGEENSVKYLRG